MKDDPRLGLPSASAALENELCPGRWRLQREFDALSEGVEIEEEQDGAHGDLDRDAEAGKRIHRIYAGEPCPEATEAERQRARQAMEVDTRIHEQWASTFDGKPYQPIVTMREHRWWLKDEAGNPIYSGQTDLVKIRGDAGGPVDILVGDLKGLWGQKDAADLNKQLHHYIALIAASITDLGYTELASAAAYLNQPAVTMKPALVPFDRDDIGALLLEMQIDLAAMMDPDAPRAPGPIQCHRCRAKLICPEFIAAIDEPTLPIVDLRSPLPIPDKETLKAKVELLSGPALAKILPWLPVFDNMVALTKSEAKRRLRADPASVPGWHLKKNSSRSKIVDLQKIWNRLVAQYELSAEEFLKLCSITKENCENIIREKSGLKGQKLDAKVSVVLDGCTMPIKVSDSLEEGPPLLTEP